MHWLWCMCPVYVLLGTCRYHCWPRALSCFPSSPAYSFHNECLFSAPFPSISSYTISRSSANQWFYPDPTFYSAHVDIHLHLPFSVLLLFLQRPCICNYFPCPDHQSESTEDFALRHRPFQAPERSGRKEQGEANVGLHPGPAARPPPRAYYTVKTSCAESSLSAPYCMKPFLKLAL